MPKLKLSTKIDRYYDALQEIEWLQEQLKETKEYKDLMDRKEKAQILEQSILTQHTSKELKFAKGKRALLEGKENDSYKIVSRKVLEDYAYQHDALDLFQNRLTVEVVRRMLEAGEKIPGIQKSTKVSITVRGIE